MPEIIAKGTPGVYKGNFPHIRGLGGYAKEDTPVAEGFIWMIFDGKREHRIEMQYIDWMPMGTKFDNKTEKQKPVEVIVEVEASE